MSLGIISGDYQVYFFDPRDPDGPLGDISEYEGCVVEIWTTKDRVVHREGAPAVIYRDLETGDVVRSVFYERGLIHRDAGPAVEESWDGRHVIEYYQYDRAHRDNGPWRIETCDRTGVVTHEEYARMDSMHREGNLPSTICRDPDTGIVIEERYVVNGKAYRTNGPAEIERDRDTGIVIKEKYRREGEPYRDGEPAVILRDPTTGEITHRKVFQNGKPVDGNLISEPSP